MVFAVAALSLGTVSNFEPQRGNRPHSPLLRYHLVRFSSVDLLVGLALGAEAALDDFHEPEDEASLLLSGVAASRAGDTALRHLPILLRYVRRAHFVLPDS